MTKKEKEKKLPTKEQVESYEMLFPMLESLMKELRELSANNPDSELSNTKVSMVNKMMARIKDFLPSDNMAEFLDLLDTDSPPTNSDTLLILSQYKSAMNQFRDKYCKLEGFDYRWLTEED